MKTKLIFMLIILAVILLSCVQQQNNCVLMQNKATKNIDCFGCAGTLCKDPPAGWITVQDASARCIVTSQGCKLQE